MEIRTATLSDAAEIQAIYSPIVEHTAISFEEAPPTIDEMARRIEETLLGYPYLVAERRGVVVGYAYAAAHRTRAAYRSSVDVTVYVAEGARQIGVGRQLYGVLLPDLAGRGFHAAFAGITLPNAGSIRLHETMGFKALGVYHEVGCKFGRWHDVGWWQRLL